jgi:NAD(P)-dependent dehydrogenase (short-subunit alcohol dehydrogenase family)
MTTFKDKVAFVTGGASGIGRALCEELARRGATVVIADINGTLANDVAAAIGNKTGKVHVAVLDVSKAEQVQQAVDDCVARFGRLDYMFNNAAIGIVGEVRDMTIDLWNRIVDVNLKGIINGVMAAYPQMIRQQSGHIINTSSSGGLIAMPTQVPYSATKFGIVGLSTGLRLEAASLGVKVSVVCPGLVKTSVFDTGTYLKLDPDEIRAKKMPFEPMMPHDCSVAILRGVERNDAIIMTHPRVKVRWWLSRINPALEEWASQFILKDFRKSRDNFLAKTAAGSSGK